VFDARIIAIGAAADASTRRVAMRSEIANPDRALKAEMFAMFKISIGEGDPSPSVPVDAVIREGDDSFVWVEQKPMHFKRRKVELGLEQDSRLQVVSGLAANEWVVGRGVIYVENEWKQ
jgi:cobalt-zinc-cadmium efflux system membrane fusion protein